MGHRGLLWVAVALIVVGVVGTAAAAVLMSRASVPAARTSRSRLVPRGRMMRPSPGPPQGIPSVPGTTLPGPAALLGQRIFDSGRGENGRVIPRTGGLGMMGTDGCARCHGSDGLGRSFELGGEGVVAPDISYGTLTTQLTEDSTTSPAWTDADIKRAIRDGVEPNGESLQGLMPRWQMTDGELEALVTYLKELKGT